MMPLGARFYNNSGTIQIDGKLPLLSLHSKASFVVPGDGLHTMYLPSDMSPSKASLAALRPVTGAYSMIHAWIWHDNMVAEAGNRGGYKWRGPPSGSAEWFMFCKTASAPVLTPGNGLRFFHNGELVYHSGMKVLRVVDSFRLGWNGLTSFSLLKSYVAGRLYAVAMSGTNIYTTYTFDHTEFDPVEKQTEYFYRSQKYVPAFQAVSGGIEFVTIDAGDEFVENWGPGQTTAPAPHFSGESPQILIIDVTHY